MNHQAHAGRTNMFIHRTFFVINSLYWWYIGMNVAPTWAQPAISLTNSLFTITSRKQIQIFKTCFLSASMCVFKHAIVFLHSWQTNYFLRNNITQRLYFKLNISLLVIYCISVSVALQGNDAIAWSSFNFGTHSKHSTGYGTVFSFERRGKLQTLELRGPGVRILLDANSPGVRLILDACSPGVRILLDACSPGVNIIRRLWSNDKYIKRMYSRGNRGGSGGGGPHSVKF